MNSMLIMKIINKIKRSQDNCLRKNIFPPIEITEGEKIRRLYRINMLVLWGSRDTTSAAILALIV